MTEEELRRALSKLFIPPDVHLRIQQLEIERDQLRAELEIACHVSAGDKVSFDWAVLRLIDEAREALNNLCDAVAYDLRHSDDPDEDKSWDALTKLNDALSAARRMIDKIDGKPMDDSNKENDT